MKHLATLGVPPPRNPHDRVETGRFLRALIGRTLVVTIVAWVLILLLDRATWMVVLAGITVAMLALEVVWLDYRVRRDERRG